MDILSYLTSLSTFLLPMQATFIIIITITIRIIITIIIIDFTIIDF
jgi:hypothetical protein